MRSPHALLLACLLVMSAPAFSAGAATAIDTARAQAVAARAKVSEIRSKQLYTRAELNKVASRIEALKAQQGGALLTGSELDAQLQRSQELSGALTETAQRLSVAESDLEQENLAYLNALNAELAQIRAQWDQTQDRAAKAKVMARMKTLRAERDGVRAQLPASRVPALAGTRSDDPEELLEQADAIRDSEDKVRQKMAALKTRIGEIKDERELDRRMSDFLDDESMFDDSDRRLRQTRERELARQGQPGLFGPPAADSASAAPAENAAAPAAGSDTSGGGSFESSPDPARDSTASEPTRSAPVNITSVVKGADSRPQLSGTDALLHDASDSSDLSALEAQLQQLDSLAKQLDGKADELEQRAKSAE